MIKIFTIGVYESTEESFFDKLQKNKIDLFCDIRQRRGVRGAKYKYVNSTYLQAKLKELGIAYLYIKDLAPTTEIREKQKEADAVNGVSKKQRNCLGSVFQSEYTEQILNKFDFNNLLKEIKKGNFQNVVFFCVEARASACHRSLVAKRVQFLLNSEVIDL